MTTVIKGLDTYYGRNVKVINVNADGTFHVELDGGVHIVNNDPNTPNPNIPADVVPNLRLVMAILDVNETQLVLRNNKDELQEWRVRLNPVKYHIVDPTVPGDGWYPQHPVEAQPKIPPHPDARIAEGPEPIDDDDDIIEDVDENNAP